MITGGESGKESTDDMSPTVELALRLAGDIETFPIGDCSPSDDPDKLDAYVYGFQSIAKRFVAAARRIGDATLTDFLKQIDAEPEDIRQSYSLHADLIGIIDYLKEAAATPNYGVSEVAQIPLKSAAPARHLQSLALLKAIQTQFNESNWMELALMLDKMETIKTHSRLLRSLSFGDGDYGSCIADILPSLLGADHANFQVIADYLDLPNWLKANEPKLFADLYGGKEITGLSDLQSVAGVLSLDALQRHADRITRSVSDDPEQAIGSAKEMLESVMKAVLEMRGHSPGDDIPTLLRQVQCHLELEPKAWDGSVQPGGETIKRTLSNLGQIVIGVAEVRNLYGTGHGKFDNPVIQQAHARLVINAAVSIAFFLLEIWQANSGDQTS